MENSNKHIEEFLDYYLNKEQSPDYAVLITGCWGSGKTYFIRHFLEKQGASKKKFCQENQLVDGF
jgi:KAP family P-loop domain.